MVIGSFVAIARGVLTRRTLMFSGWTAVTVGTIEFVGMPCLSLAYRLQPAWGQFNAGEVGYLIAGLVLYLVTLYGVYQFLPGAENIAGKSLLKNPELRTEGLVKTAVFSLVLSMFYQFNVPVPLVGQLLKVVGNKAIAFGTVLIFCAWMKRRDNPALMTLLVGFVFYGICFGILAGSGRRTLLTVIGGLPVAYYYLHDRLRDPSRILWRYTLAGLVVVSLIVVYGGLRHRSKRTGVSQDLSYAIDTIRRIPSTFMKADGDQLLGQRSIEISLLSKRTYKNDPHPFHSLLFVASNPVPRRFWPDKPVGLGYSLPKDARAKTRATWGPGIVGHAAHEGSLLFVCFYAGLLATFLRLLDEFLVRQPDNPFLIGLFVSIFPHIIGWVRGDIGTFTIQILGGVLSFFLFRNLAVYFDRSSYREYADTRRYTMWQLLRGFGVRGYRDGVAGYAAGGRQTV